MKTLSKNALRLWSILISTVVTTSADRLLTAQEPGSWKRVPLTKEFYSEGGAIGDLDNDGQVDVIAGPNVYWGPEFKVSTPIYDGKPFSINGYSDNFFSWTFDVDQDGQLDVLVAGFPGQQGWWFKNPGPKLARTSRWTRLLITEVVDNESPEFLDITGDGKPELVCSQGGRYCYIEIPKDPTQPWVPKFITEPGGFQRFTHGLGVGDVNDDGRKDLLAQGGWWEQPTSLTSEGPWKFHPFEFTPAGGAQMHAVDLDGDGKTEVVTSLQAHGYGLAVFKKLDAVGDKFERIDVMTDKVETSPTGLVISQLHAVAIADVDRDGIPDIVTGKRFWAHQGHDPGEHEPVLLVWFKTARTGAGLRFVANVIDDDSGVGTQISLADIDQDGRIDIFSASKRGANILLQRAETAVEKEVPALVAAGKPYNLNFELGDLRGWTGSGSAFFRQPVDSTRVRDQEVRQEGKYWLGTSEIAGDIAQGTLESSPFVIDKPKASFLLAGGDQESTRLEIVDAQTKQVLLKFVGRKNETLEKQEVDLQPWLNRSVFLRIVDNESSEWGRIHFDHFQLID